MILVKSVAVVCFLSWTLQCSVYSSPQTPKEAANSKNATKKNEAPGTPVHVAERTIDEDFPPLGFKIKDVMTTSLDRSNHTSAFQPNNFSAEVSIDDLLNDTQRTNLSRLNYETFWSNGSLTLTLVDLEKLNDENENATHDVWSNLSDLELEEPVLEPGDFHVFDNDHQSSRRHRRKRHVFGGDDRRRVPHVDSKQLPYSAVVRISTGCSGTLISEYHVLTAAHCVHSGMKWNFDDPKEVKVFILRHQGKVIQIGVDYVKVPRGWTLSRDYRYDYAVLRLRRPHRNKYLDLYEIPADLSVHMRIQFASFPADKPLNTVWYSYCKAFCVNHAILNRCDSFYGSSGAGIFGKITRGRRERRFVMGVFSGSLHIKYGKRKKKRRMNVATKLTPLKSALIKNWLNLPPSSIRGALSHETVAKFPNVPPGH